jgi:ribonuclease HII
MSFQNRTIVAGIDECGWGAFAGPIVSVVAVMYEDQQGNVPHGVTDSKKLSTIRLESLFNPLTDFCLDYGVGHSWPHEIDEFGPAQGLQLAYSRAFAELTYNSCIDILYVDGSHPMRFFPRAKQVVEPKADLTKWPCSIASILGKVFRDRVMVETSKRFPQYNLASNKGYGTADHDVAIKEGGLITVGRSSETYLHRKTYCKKYM